MVGICCQEPVLGFLAGKGGPLDGMHRDLQQVESPTSGIQSESNLVPVRSPACLGQQSGFRHRSCLYPAGYRHGESIATAALGLHSSLRRCLRAIAGIARRHPSDQTATEQGGSNSPHSGDWWNETWSILLHVLRNIWADVGTTAPCCCKQGGARQIRSRAYEVEAVEKIDRLILIGCRVCQPTPWAVGSWAEGSWRAPHLSGKLDDPPTSTEISAALQTWSSIKISTRRGHGKSRFAHRAILTSVRAPVGFVCCP